MTKTNVQIINQLKQFLEDAISKKAKYCRRAEDFTRNRKLSFERVVGLLINIPRKSLSVELNELFKHLGLGICHCTKSAFSQARYKLKHCFFEDWNDELKSAFYTANEDRVKRWKGFLLFGVDGSTAHLFEDREGKIAKHFGKYRGAVTARLVCCYDVLNRINYLGSIRPIKVSENEVARNWLTKIEQELPSLGQVLCLYDMKFPGFAFAYEHIARGIDFVMRAEPNFNVLVHNFMRLGQKDRVEKWYPPKEAIKDLKRRGHEVEQGGFLKVRLTKVFLENGEVEVLISTLLNKKKYPYKDFQGLYFQRWGSETNFDYWKNKAQIENISGHSVEAIHQDFYASIFTANLHSLIEHECEEELIEINHTREHDYAPNRNVGLGVLKGRILDLFFKPNQEEALEELRRLFLFHLEPVRPGRSFPRKKRVIHAQGKYATMTNYRRAI